MIWQSFGTTGRLTCAPEGQLSQTCYNFSNVISDLQKGKFNTI